MPFALILFGIIFILIGYQGTQDDFWKLIKGDFTGSGNFLYWIVAVGVVGAVGYIPKAKPISDGFLVLLLVVLFLTKGTGFFARFQQAIGAASASNAGGYTSPSGNLIIQPVGVPAQ